MGAGDFLRERRARVTALIAVLVAFWAAAPMAFVIAYLWLVDQRDTLKAASNAAAMAATLEMKRVLAENPGIGDVDLRKALMPTVRNRVLENLLHLSEDRYAKAADSLVIGVRLDRSRGTVQVSAQANLTGFIGEMFPFLSDLLLVESTKTGSRANAPEIP